MATFVYAVLVLVSIGPGPDVPEFDGWLTAFEVVDLARSFTAPPDGAAVLAALRGPGRCRSLGGHLGRSAA